MSEISDTNPGQSDVLQILQLRYIYFWQPIAQCCGSEMIFFESGFDFHIILVPDPVSDPARIFPNTFNINFTFVSPTCKRVIATRLKLL